jgi:hypothetical protein
MDSRCDHCVLRRSDMHQLLHVPPRLSDELCHLARHHCGRFVGSYLQLEEAVRDQARIGLDFICYIST